MGECRGGLSWGVFEKRWRVLRLHDLAKVGGCIEILPEVSDGGLAYGNGLGALPPKRPCTRPGINRLDGGPSGPAPSTAWGVRTCIKQKTTSV